MWEIRRQDLYKVRAIYGEGLFKNVDKNIRKKDIIQKLADGL
jgi:hypothetical protein